MVEKNERWSMAIMSDELMMNHGIYGHWNGFGFQSILLFVHQLMLSKGMRSLSTPIAKVASISHDLGQVTGLDVSSEVGLVPEVGDARDAFPLSINFGHVHGHIRRQRLSFAWKIKTTLLTFLQMMVRVTTMLLADAKHFFRKFTKEVFFH